MLSRQASPHDDSERLQPVCGEGRQRVRRAGNRGQDPEEMRGGGKVVEEARLRSRTSGDGRSLAIAGVSH